ncbi:cation:dicarboxylate symporter family transporter [Arthrobacter sp. JCM 19049]|uniref:cation:dicarboxylate symporter family transporter n=1 Tax=Arthrobacter sp. JCM 19049 TaxID=1460643 RepID=UPI002436B032
MPEWLGGLFLTYNSIFSGFLGFIVPLIILGLVMPAIAELGKGAGKWLGITAVIAYGSTITAGLLATSSAAGCSPRRFPAAGWRSSGRSPVPGSPPSSPWSLAPATRPPRSSCPRSST